MGNQLQRLPPPVELVAVADVGVDECARAYAHAYEHDTQAIYPPSVNVPIIFKQTKKK